MAYFPTLFSTDNVKAAKASGFGYLNAIHYMAPYTLGGVGNLCPKATQPCFVNCLGWQSGHAAMVKDLDNGTNAVRESRKLKAQLFMKSRADYMNRLARDIARLHKRAARDGLKLCVRLNGSTDVSWEKIRFPLEEKTVRAILKAIPHSAIHGIATIPELFPDIQFVDYTKNPNRFSRAPRNLDLTLSYSVENIADCVEALEAGHNVAMIFDGGLPESFAGYHVLNGDLHDLRHLDKKGGFIVGLTPKGKRAKADQTGFVVRAGESRAILASRFHAAKELLAIKKRAQYRASQPDLRLELIAA